MAENELDISSLFLMKAKESISSEFDEFNRFVDTYSIASTVKTDEKANILLNIISSNSYYRKFKYDSTLLIEFYEKLYNCIKTSEVLIVAQEVPEEYSGIYLDFDILQKANSSQITDEMIENTCKSINNILLNMLNINIKNIKNFTSTYVITRRQEISLYNDTSIYKDGMHIIIPDIKITKDAKTYLWQHLEIIIYAIYLLM